MTKRPAEQIQARRIQGDDQVAAGFFFALDLAVFGGATGSGPRSIELRRPDVKV
jgi:hypothetical protein